MSNERICKLFNDSKYMIDKTLNIFLFNLIKYIFLKERKYMRTSKVNKKIEDFINEINKNIIKKKFNKAKFISNEYTKDNLLNILNFVKFQNSIYANEIIENILIFMFNFAFKNEKENIFEKYIYNDMEKIKTIKNFDITKWFNPKEFKDNIERLNKPDNLKKLIEYDISNQRDMKAPNELEDEPILCLLKEKEEIKNEKKINCYKNFFNYMFFSLDYEDFINNKTNDNCDNSNTLTSCKSVSGSTSNYFLNKTESPFNKPTDMKYFRSLLISVYIYSQNKFSPKIEYSKESKNEKDLVKIPFSYNLSEAVVEDKFSGTILSPLRIEPRIDEIKLAKNPLKYNGFYELSKVLLFNKNIKKIDLHLSMLKSYYIQLFIFGLKLFNKNNVEELDLSINFLKEDCSEYLANLLLYLNNLKTIILNSNELKRGISSFLIVLKNLYRQGKTKLEKLYLNNCQLDDIAFYELGELLKCKYCKLKKLFLNENNIPSSVNFLKKIKKNNSLIEIYFNKCNIENKDTDDIMRIISNTSINLISLNNNQINNIEGLLKIIFRTKLIKIKSKKVDIDKMDFCGESYFYNLDLGKNCCYNKNKDKIDLLKKGIEETTLSCLDFSQIIFNPIPQLNPFLFELNKDKKTNDKETNDKSKNDKDQNLYYKSVKSLVIKLKKEQYSYKERIWKLKNTNSEIEKIEKINDIKYKDIFNDMDDDINQIINNKNAKYPLFIKKKCTELLLKHGEKIKKSTELLLKHEEKIKNNKLSEEDIKRISKILENYIKLKKLAKDLKQFEKIVNKKKLVLI